MSEPSKSHERIERYNHDLRGYEYQPLLPSHIRLLSVDIGSKQRHLIHTSIHTTLGYSSVSYCWNDQQRDRDLDVDGYNLKIMENLWAGLPYLSKEASTQLLWIDSICIDQENEKEKEVQIPLMQEIYSRCQECLVWLGDGTPETDIAIDAIPRISRLLKIRTTAWVWEREGIATSSPKAIDTPLWKGIVDLFSRPWFTRVWTFQETVLPHHVLFLCGSKMLAFTDMEPLAKPLLDHLSSLVPDANLGKPKLWVGFQKVLRIAEFKNFSRKPRKSLDTLRLLSFTRPWAAFNRLDKIYGMLGLANSSLQDFLRVDYNITKAQASRQVAQWYISFGEDLFILNLASSRTENDDGLPSWIPNIPHLGSHWCIGVIWHRFRTGMGQGSVHRPFASLLSEELRVHGICVDQVTHVAPDSDKTYTSQADRCRKILDWEEACLSVSKSVFRETSGTVPDAHWTTIISGICDNYLKPNRGDYDLLKSFLKVKAAGQCLPFELEARQQDFGLQIRRLWQVVKYGKYFCTQHGRIGLGPITTLRGDQICVLYNGFTPFILRKRSDIGPTYQLVGDSYTYGLMDGEAFQSDITELDETFILV